MRWIFALAMMSGCGFSVSGAEDRPSPDAGPRADGPAADGPVAKARKCDEDPALRLCLDFENDNRFTDGSSYGNDAEATNVASTPRANELAASLVAGSRLLVKESPDLDIPLALTISMWMQIDHVNMPPPMQGRWLLDNNTQYFLAVRDGGKLRCGGQGTITLDTQPGVVGVMDEAWHHVGCTFDGAKFSIYVDGDRVACQAAANPISIAGDDGLAVGANLGNGPVFSETFLGGLDNVQVHARAKSPAEMCTAAGRNECEDVCLL